MSEKQNIGGGGEDVGGSIESAQVPMSENQNIGGEGEDVGGSIESAQVPMSENQNIGGGGEDVGGSMESAQVPMPIEETVPALSLSYIFDVTPSGHLVLSGQEPTLVHLVGDEFQGPLYQKTDKIKSDHLPPVQNNWYKKPVLVHQGNMQWLYDHEGRRYLDLFAGIVTVSVGHCHPKVTHALQEQIKTLWHTTCIYRNPKIYEYVEKLVTKLPGHLKVVYLVNSGTEATDLATVLAKVYTGNNDVISLQSAYHGYSSAILGLTAQQSYRLPIPVPAGYSHAMLPDPYRGIWSGCRDSLSQVPGACSCPGDCVSSDKYVHQLEEHICATVPKGKVAAFFAESIQGVNGTLQFPKGYIRKAQQLVKENGGLFVADEVQTGFGRTGDHFWGFEGHGIIPDIVTMAKGIGNGFPMAAVVSTKEIAAAHTKAAYFNTFGGNPLAATVGKAVLDVIEEENLQENCKITGKYFIEQLMQLQKVHPVIGDVRGKGLMLGLELSVPGSNDPLKASNVSEINETIKDMGVLIGIGGRHGNVLRIKPPMCITREDVDFSISVLDQAFTLFENKK